MPFTLKDLPMLQKIALTPMCTQKLARSREDLKLLKSGKLDAVGPIPANNMNNTVRIENDVACNLAPGKFSQVSVSPLATAQADSTNDLGNATPVISDLCMGKEDSSKVLDSQGRGDAGHGSCRSNDVEKQRTVPALIEKKELFRDRLSFRQHIGFRVGLSSSGRRSSL
ncbi:hypothetical protein BS78_07G098000 [Paspalum vaginatum]|nr:hypothetical protein BS78_07G098000 [Paspalum vaginatum]